MLFKTRKAGKNPTISAGPDGNHSCIVKETAETICIPLAIIFNRFLQEGQFLQGWKHAYVTALHKKEYIKPRHLYTD